MPITNREEARESGFAQVREAMLSFEGDVISAEFGQWGGKLIDEDTGKPIPPKEFLEVQCTNVEVLEVSEELAMAVDEWNFRVNCSDFSGSFWIDKFLEATDRFKIQVPDELVGKRIVWKKTTLVAREPKFNSTNYVVGSVKAVAKAAPRVVISPKVPIDQTQENSPSEGNSETIDPMELALDLAIGKTETQFRSAVSLHPQFVNSPLLPLAKAGAITQSLVTEGKLVLVGEGNKAVYQRPE